MGGKVIHFADKTDREIGTARCGASIVGGGAGHTEDIELVTCAKCNGGTRMLDPAVVWHLPGGTEGKTFCGAPADKVAIAFDPDDATCPACLLAWGKGIAAQLAKEAERADRMSAACAGACERADRAESRLEAAQDFAQRQKEIAAQCAADINGERERTERAVEAVRALARLI